MGKRLGFVWILEPPSNVTQEKKSLKSEHIPPLPSGHTPFLPISCLLKTTKTHIQAHCKIFRIYRSPSAFSWKTTRSNMPELNAPSQQQPMELSTSDVVTQQPVR